MYKIYYLSPNGDYVDLTSQETPYMLKENGIQGMVGQTTDITTPNSRSGGNRFNGIAVNPMTGSLKILVNEEGDREGRKLGELIHDIRTYFSRSRKGRLVISDDNGFGEHYCNVRLASNISAPLHDPHDPSNTTSEVEINLICDEGVWIRRREYKGSVIKVVNDGDLPLYPIIRMKTPLLITGTLTLPSGVSVSLPNSLFGIGNIYIHTDPQTSYKLTDENDEINVNLWRNLSDMVGEPVMPFEEEEFRFNVYNINQVSLIADVKVLDPWR